MTRPLQSDNIREWFMKNNTGQLGFTLVEVLIVVAIMGILAAATIPGIMSTIPRYRLRAGARELAINFKKAKLEAVKRNRDVVIEFTGVGTPAASYRIYANDDRIITPRSFNPATDTLLISQPLGSTVQLVSTTFTNNQSGFNSKGFPLGAANQNIVLSSTDGTRSFTLTVSQAGNVRLQ